MQSVFRFLLRGERQSTLPNGQHCNSVEDTVYDYDKLEIEIFLNICYVILNILKNI